MDARDEKLVINNINRKCMVPNESFMPSVSNQMLTIMHLIDEFSFFYI